MKGNRALNVILLLLAVPVVSLATLAIYHYGPRVLGADDQPSKAKRLPEIRRSEPANSVPTSNLAAAPSNTVATANANSASSTNTVPASSSPQGTATFPFLGKWVRVNGKEKTTYIFEQPKKVGNVYVGTLKIIDNARPQPNSTYTVVSSNTLKMQEEGGAALDDWNYVVAVDGKSMKITVDGDSWNVTR